MPGRRTSRRQRATWPKWSALALRLVLLVAAWQGPIPWCHGHAGLLSQDSPAWLGEHLQLYHGGQAGHWEFLGWHVHADFLRSPIGDDEPPRGSPPEFPVSLIAGARAIADAAAPPADAVRWVPAASGCDGIATQDRCALTVRPHHFFASYASDLPLPLRFSILRC